MKKIVLLSIIFLTACSSIGIDTCAPDINPFWGTGDVNRMRNAQLRIQFQDEGVAAAEKFLPYAAMSALVYDDDRICVDSLASKNKPDNPSKLKAMLSDWDKLDDPILPQCNDEKTGLFYRVWYKTTDSGTDVVFAYRGTEFGTFTDWFQGNFRWFMRFTSAESQYVQSRMEAKDLVERLEAQFSESGPVRFYTTGHSLGGGLAQNVYYSMPDKILQSYAFASSPVTMWSDNDKKTKIKGCECDDSLNSETRIYRIYESGEILAYLRYPSKLFKSLTRQISEVRFAFKKSPNALALHSMENLANNLQGLSQQSNFASNPWYTATQFKGENCTAKLENSQQALCNIQASENNICPGN